MDVVGNRMAGHSSQDKREWHNGERFCGRARWIFKAHPRVDRAKAKFPDIQSAARRLLEYGAEHEGYWTMVCLAYNYQPSLCFSSLFSMGKLADIVDLKQFHEVGRDGLSLAAIPLTDK